MATDELADVRRDLRDLAARMIWRAYLPAEPVRVTFGPLASCRGRVWWNGSAWSLEVAEDVDDWRRVLLHEVAHVKLGHVKREIPAEVKAGRADEAMLAERFENLNRLAELVVAKQEREADEWASRERSKW